MGAWGTGIFSDDYTMDIKDNYLILLRCGKTKEEAVSILRDEEKPERDTEYGHLFWVALALAQWRYGHLMDEIKDKALEALASGADERLWASGSAADQRKREKVRREVREKLNSPQPPEKTIRIAKGKKVPFKIGDVVAIQSPDNEHALASKGIPEISGKYMLLHVVDYCYQIPWGFRPDCGIHDKCAVVYAYNWWGELPEYPDFIQELEPLNIEKYAQQEKGDFLHNYCFTMWVSDKIFYKEAKAVVIGNSMHVRHFKNLPGPYEWGRAADIHHVAFRIPMWLKNARDGDVLVPKQPKERLDDENGMPIIKDRRWVFVELSDEELRRRGKHMRFD